MEQLYKLSKSLERVAVELEADNTCGQSIDSFELERTQFLLDQLLAVTKSLAETMGVSPDKFAHHKSNRAVFGEVAKSVFSVNRTGASQLRQYFFLFVGENTSTLLGTTLTLVAQTVSFLESINALPNELLLLSHKLGLLYNNQLVFELRKAAFLAYSRIKQNVKQATQTLPFFLLFFKELRRFLSVDACLFRNQLADFVEGFDSTQEAARVFWKEAVREAQWFVQNFRATNEEELNPGLWALFCDELDALFALCKTFDATLQQVALEEQLKPLTAVFIERTQKAAAKTAVVVLEKGLLVPANSRSKHSAAVVELYKYLLPKLQIVLRFPVDATGIAELASVLTRVLEQAVAQITEKAAMLAKQPAPQELHMFTLTNNLLVLREKYEETLLVLRMEEKAKAYLVDHAAQVGQAAELFFEEIGEEKSNLLVRIDTAVEECLCKLFSLFFAKPLGDKLAQKLQALHNSKPAADHRDTLLEELSTTVSRLENALVDVQTVVDSLLGKVYVLVLDSILTHVQHTKKTLHIEEANELLELVEDLDELFGKLSDNSAALKLKVKDHLFYYKEKKEGFWLETCLTNWKDQFIGAENEEEFPYGL